MSAIAACLCGLVFLGTPHRWPDSTALKSLFKKICTITQPNQPYTKPSTRALCSVTNAFDQFIGTKGNGEILWSFFEEEPMVNLGLVG
jgi:hypothetical protein